MQCLQLRYLVSMLHQTVRIHSSYEVQRQEPELKMLNSCIWRSVISQGYDFSKKLLLIQHSPIHFSIIFIKLLKFCLLVWVGNSGKRTDAWCSRIECCPEYLHNKWPSGPVSNTAKQQRNVFGRYTFPDFSSCTLSILVTANSPCKSILWYKEEGNKPQ